MQAAVLGLMIPVIPLWIEGRYHKGGRTNRELLLRYVVYTLLITLLSGCVMIFMCEEGTSFWEKVDRSSSFVLKYAAIQTAFALLVALAEALLRKEILVQVDWRQYRELWVVRFTRKYLFPAGLYLLAILVIVLNVKLMFDNVLWGDEAFSANTAQKSLDGILQVLYYWDSHPPLYYYWLKGFGELFGYQVPVYHLASLVPFILGILLAVTALRKHFGNLPAALFVLVSGLASSCVEYNLEVRMYALAFFGVLACFYCSYRVLSGGKAAWTGMVLWALVAAYSHYYALVTVGILLFITGVAYWVRRGRRAWIKGLTALLVFIAGYLPWMSFLLKATESVSNNWWMTEVLALKESLSIVTGDNMSTVLLPLLVVMLLISLLAESAVFESRKKDGKPLLQIHTPSLKGWSDEAYAAAVGALTVAGTVVFAYLLCAAIGPVLAQRYLYPLSAVSFLLLVIESSHMLKLLRSRKRVAAGKATLFALLAVLAVIGIKGYKEYSDTTALENQKTMETLSLMGEVEEDVVLVSNGVQHLGWTVLAYYFPEREIVNGNYGSTQADRFWYFTPDVISEEAVQELTAKGYSLAGYGEYQLAKYPFVLYYLERQGEVK